MSTSRARWAFHCWVWTDPSARASRTGSSRPALRGPPISDRPPRQAAQYGVLGAQGEAKAFAGADASAKVSVGKDGLHGGAEAFAGAKATGSLSADVAGVGAGVNGEAWAGAGAEAKADLGRTDGKYTIGGEVGLGLGLGGKVGFSVNVDAGKLGDALGDGADAVGDAWDSTVGSWFWPESKSTSKFTEGWDPLWRPRCQSRFPFHCRTAGRRHHRRRWELRTWLS
ncbi:hypothetical protein ACRAWF_43865 [Streptomyces sp. L7]